MTQKQKKKKSVFLPKNAEKRHEKKKKTKNDKALHGKGKKKGT